MLPQMETGFTHFHQGVSPRGKFSRVGFKSIFFQSLLDSCSNSKGETQALALQS